VRQELCGIDCGYIELLQTSCSNTQSHNEQLTVYMYLYWATHNRPEDLFANVINPLTPVPALTGRAEPRPFFHF